MRILIIDDKQIHRESARETLVGHDLTIVNSFDEAMERLNPDGWLDEEKFKQLVVDAGFQPESDVMKMSDHVATDYLLACANARKQAHVAFLPFDVVLTDMKMPMSEYALQPRVFNSSEQVPYGFVIALKATLSGAKFVAMLTDTNHHRGAMSAALDFLVDPSWFGETERPIFMINDARVMFIHAPFVNQGYGDQLRKDWGKVLAALIAD